MEGMNEAAAEVPALGGDHGDGEQEKGRVRKLVAALRSGDYAQGRRFLRTEEGFCCLGVACEVAMAAGAPMTRAHGHDGYRYVFHEPGNPYPGSSERVLPLGVMQWYGFELVNPWLRIPTTLARKYAVSLAQNPSRLLEQGEEELFGASELNDYVGMSLADIGQCFEYTFLREDWEARHGAAES